MNDSSPPRELEVAIVGAGFGGLCMGMKLLEAGIREFVILEKDGEVGGTWRDNTYPGAACDVQSHFYSYSFDGKPDWSMRYAGWEEIQRYILDTTARHGLRSHVRFGEAVNSARFDQANGRWDIATRSGTRADRAAPRAGDRTAARAADPEDTRARVLQGQGVPLGALGPRL